MVISTSPVQRLLLAGGFALAVASAPLVAAVVTVSTTPAGSAVASCPTGEAIDPSTGACKSTTLNPLDPENLPLEAGSITNSRAGNTGQLGEVKGIPCTGASGGGGGTGECIGLSESQNANQFQEPKSGVNPANS